MTKISEVAEQMLKDARERHRVAADGVAAAERTLVKRRGKLAEIDTEVRELEADLQALRRRPLQFVS